MATRTNFPTASSGAADSIAAPTIGWCSTTSTTDAHLDLGRTPDHDDALRGVGFDGSYITLEAETEDCYVLFSDNIAETIDVDASVGTVTVEGSRNILTTAAIDVPRTIYAGVPNPPMLVPRGKTVMIYRTGSGTGLLRFTRS